MNPRWLSLALVCALGCKASVSAEANAAGSGDDEAGAGSGERSLLREREPFDTDGEQGESLNGPETALLGARHDVRLATSQLTARCSCLAVAIGRADDAAFQWRSSTPVLDTTRQLVVALTSEGVACTRARGGDLGASYWGYRQVGDDVVIVVEAAREGRPITRGAVIPKPQGAGQIIVTPLDKSAPYGRALDGGEKCLLGRAEPIK